MFKLFKWAAIAAVTVGVGSFAVFGSDALSYVTTAASNFRTDVKDSIPVEFEIRRAEGLVEEIEPEIRKCKTDLAGAEVDLRDLMRSVEALERRVQGEEQALKTRTAHAGNGETYGLASDFRRRTQNIELARVFDSYKSNLTILTAKRKMVVRQTKMVTAAKQRLATVSAEKSRLEDQIGALKAQKKWLDAMKAETHRFDLDDSTLAQAREALKNVQRRLDVTQRMIENEAYFNGEEAYTELSQDRDVQSEIDEFFAGKSERGALGSSH